MVSHRAFGIDIPEDSKKEPEFKFDRLVAALPTLPKLDRVEAQIVLSDVYDQIFGVYNHMATDSHPFSTVMMHPAEDISKVDPFKDYLMKYTDFRVDRLGIKFFEFMDLPPYIIKMILKQARKIESDVSSALDGLDEFK